MATAVKRIVVKVTAEDKRVIAAKARRLQMPVATLMRRAVIAYSPCAGDAELFALAHAAMSAADRAGAAIDDSLIFIQESNQRIAAMEAQATRTSASRTV